jgi:tripartite ATP-independent transporter DctP family solute receptor
MLGTIAIWPSGARAAQFSYKFGSDNSSDNPLNVRMREMWAAVKTETGGKLDVAVYPNNELGGASSMQTQLRTGALQFLGQDGVILSSVVPKASISGVGFAFENSQEAWRAMDGDLGTFVRTEIEGAGIHAFPRPWENGMRQVTSGTKPVQTVDDIQGFKIRTPSGKLWVDLFASLGAAPTAMNFNEVYTSLQTKIIDGQENPLAVIELSRLYEVQKTLSLTNHMWSCHWLVANRDAWDALPKDVQGVVNRNVDKYVQLQRGDLQKMNASLLSKLEQQGLKVNKVERAPFRAKLSDFYKRWKVTFGDQGWAALEKYSGKLG